MRLKGDSTTQKLRGAYYTPRVLANAMVRSFEGEPHERILEPSCGDGVFIDALVDCGALNDDAHVVAVEIDGEEIAKAEKRYKDNARIEFVHEDFFAFYEKSEPASYDLIIGNPPYIRYQYLEPSQRDLMAGVLTSQGMKANKLVNAWVGFVVACTSLLTEGGRLVFVLPAELLQVVYAEDLRFFLANHFTEITLYTFNKLVFDDAEQEVVVFSGIKGTGDPRMRIVQLEDADFMMDAVRVEKPYQPLSRVHEKWTRYFVDAADASVLKALEEDDRLVRMDSLGVINVGITTGNNRYFSINDETADEYDLAELTVPLLGRSSHAGGVYFTEDDWLANRKGGKRARLLVLQNGQYEDLTAKQRAYIDRGVEQGDAEGYKCSIRESWYAVPSVWVPDAFFLRRNNRFPKFVLNACDAVSTDTMHRIKFKDGVNPKLALLAYYNSIGFAFTELCGRSYGGGVLEILPKEVGNMLLPNMNGAVISDAEVDSMVSFIDEVIRSGADIESALDRVDETLLIDVLGFTRQECEACRRIWKTLQRRRLARNEL